MRACLSGPVFTWEVPVEGASGLGFSPWQTVAPMVGALGYHGITFRILPIVPFPWFAMSTLTYIPDPALPDLLQGVQQRASALNRNVVLCEADDPRVLRAGVQAQQRGVARITLVGNRKAIEQCAAAEGLSLDGLTIRDPANDPQTAALAERLFQHRQHKGMTPEKAAAEIQKPLVFADMLVAEGKVDGSVAGAVHTTADVVRTAIQLIGTAPGTSLVSSFFLVALDKPHHPMQGGLIYTDCGLVINPTSEELVDIARAGGRSAQQLLGEEPRVAMLSFSTAGSGGKHPDVEKVQRAVALLAAAEPDLKLDGEVQFDAAVVPSIATRKLPDSKLKGRANVLVFPNLDAGNIGYKITERIGGAMVVGPLLQGLRRPANDLSRGADTPDIINAIAVTALQSA